MNKTFKGKLADGTVERIRLSTNNGLIGYKIIKFQVMPVDPMVDNCESVLQVFSVEPDSASTTIDFDDPTMLASIYIENHDGTSSGFSNFTNAVIIDNKVVNQDIYVTLASDPGSSGQNFYIELEQMKLSLNEATVATLKDMRAGPDTNFGP